MKRMQIRERDTFRLLESRTDEDGIKIVPSPEGEAVIFFHVNILLAKNTLGYSGYEDKPLPPLVHDIMSIHGVQHMFAQGYKVKVERSLAVDWDEIVPKVDAAIRKAARVVLSEAKKTSV